MDTKRAKEIASSPVMANVQYNGMPIYIENVNDKSATAQIYPLSQPGNILEVPLKRLKEQ